MNGRRPRISRVLAGTVGVFLLSAGMSLDSPVIATGEPKENKKAVVAPTSEGRNGMTVAEARERAKLIHAIYEATLDSMHHHFFRRDRSVLPARAMEDVFAELDRQTNIKASWISVNTKAMSIDHEPKNEFEKNAARAIAAGKGEYEVVEDGVYRRVGPIPLGAGCISCHVGIFNKTPQTQRFAGLVISVPITKK